MRFLTADYLYPLCTDPVEKGVLQVSSQGEILSVLKNRKEIPKEKLEFHKGILCPGFINSHCHLELSHLKGLLENGKGFLNFLSVIKKRNSFEQDKILSAIDLAEQQMLKNGIVGVGDICNSGNTILQKQKGNLQYYNFIEVFGAKEENANQIMFYAKELQREFKNHGLQSTITPHAPYSVSEKLTQEIKKIFDKKDQVLSIHMQETDEENQLFENKKGHFLTWLKSINASPMIWNKRNKSIDFLKELKSKNLLLVHNTFAKKEDIGRNYYCTCPKSNLYIENKLPDYEIFNTNKLCVGTDSLASNNSLSILDELQIIKKNSSFDLNTLLKIASKNGAEALGFKQLGTFEKGKTPGVNLISDLSKVEVIA